MKKLWDPHRWTYRVDEVRNGLWEAVADDHQGTEVRRQAWAVSDAEVDGLVEAVKNEAAEITRRRREATT